MFKIDHNQVIKITQGDTAELNLRLFNKSWLPRMYDRHRYPEFIRDSEGYMVPNIHRHKFIYDSEGVLVECHRPVGHMVDNLNHYRVLPGTKHSHQEEFIWGSVEFRLKNLTGSIVLVKHNDEYPNSIFFEVEDTADLKPGLYVYQLTYTDEDEISTTVESMFEVLEKF